MIEIGTNWRVLSSTEFEAFLRRYPRLLTIDPLRHRRRRSRRYGNRPTMPLGPLAPWLAERRYFFGVE